MKESEKKKNPNNNQTKPSRRTEKRYHNPRQDNAGKNVNGKKSESRASNARKDSGLLASDSNVGTEPSEVYENMVIHYVDDVNRSEEASQEMNPDDASVTKEKNEVSSGHSNDLEREPKQGTEEMSDSETVKDSVSSQGDSSMAEDEKVENTARVSESRAKRNSPESHLQGSRVRSDSVTNKSRAKLGNNTPITFAKPNRAQSRVTNTKSLDRSSKNMKLSSKPVEGTAEGVDAKPVEEVKEIDVLDDASNGGQSVGSDTETVDAEENSIQENEAALEQKVEEMEMRIEKLKEELRDVAALEISLYSVVPDHGSSAHKVHTPARRLSRLYIYACKYWAQGKRATTAKNTISGLVLVAKSCGNDVARLTFWLSNTIVLREIISQAFGCSRNSSLVTRSAESNGVNTTYGRPPSLKWKGGPGNKQISGIIQFIDDWQEPGTFIAALERVESWVFSRTVESVWWQAMTPYMQSPDEDFSSNKSVGRLLGPSLGDQRQGSFSINLWKNAFQDAAQRLCPVRAGGHECGCLPVLARMVMEQCVRRLDVAMFNALLRESVHEIPTDPFSDPIVDSKVLPIPAGDLSFGSGAQLKNSVGNWSRSLADMFGMDAEETAKEEQNGNEDFHRQVRDGEPKSFPLLNSLSDLLMLPKDMLMDRSIREEVCPLISLPLVKRILCNFTPDEFCPDPVPGAVLEAVNAECIVQRKLSGESTKSFPYTAAPVLYKPPSSADVAEKLAEAGKGSQLLRNVSSVQRKGYTSDEDLEELDSPLNSIMDILPSSPAVMANGNGHIESNNTGSSGTNARFDLLREVWSEC